MNKINEINCKMENSIFRLERINALLECVQMAQTEGGGLRDNTLGYSLFELNQMNDEVILQLNGISEEYRQIAGCMG